MKLKNMHNSSNNKKLYNVNKVVEINQKYPQKISNSPFFNKYKSDKNKSLTKLFIENDVMDTLESSRIKEPIDKTRHTFLGKNDYKIIDISSETEDKEISPLPVDLTKKNSHHNIEKGNLETIDSYTKEILLKKASDVLKIRLKYIKQFNLPPVSFMPDLTARAKKYFYIIDEVLSGKRRSLYYNNGRNAFKQSNKPMMSVSDFRKLDLSLFTAGYFGIKRQIILSIEILREYEDQISKKQNPVIRWWGTIDFSHYILAPEVLCYVCQEEMNLSDIEFAWNIMEDTTEFGLKVADEDPAEIWEINLEEKRLKILNLGFEYSSMNYRSDPR